MIVSKVVDTSVEQDTCAYIRGVARVVATLDVVADEIAEHDAGIFMGKCQVCQVVHFTKISRQIA